MAIRTIDAPGIEMHEIDKSQYSPAMTGTKVLVTGFANSGEDYIPMIFTSKSAWLNYYGEPDNEAERYFYAASMEVLNQNGVVNCCKLPYENEARDKFVGQKYKLVASQPTLLSTVSEYLDEDASGGVIKSAISRTKGYNKDIIKFFLDNCNVTDSTDKQKLLSTMSLSDVNVSVLLDTVNQECEISDLNPRTDGRPLSDVENLNYYKLYAAKSDLSSPSLLNKEFIDNLSKAKLLEYLGELDTIDGVMPYLKIYWDAETDLDAKIKTDARISDYVDPNVGSFVYNMASAVAEVGNLLSNYYPQYAGLSGFTPNNFSEKTVGEMTSALTDISVITNVGTLYPGKPDTLGECYNLLTTIIAKSDKAISVDAAGVEQNISVMMAYNENIDTVVLTATNRFTYPRFDTDFIIDDIEALTYSPYPNYTDKDDDPTNVIADGFFALFSATPAQKLMRYTSSNELVLRFIDGYDAFQIKTSDSLSAAGYENIKQIFKKYNYNLIKSKDGFEDAATYFQEQKDNQTATTAAQLSAIKKALLFSELKLADNTVDYAWKIEASGEPVVYPMSEIDEYRTDESRVGTNQILVVDKTRKPYGKIPEDKEHKDAQRELIGVIPVITTAANALQAQSMIDVDDKYITEYETVKLLQTLKCPYKYLGKDYPAESNIISSDVAGTSIISQRLNNVHVEGDNDDDFFDSISLEANSYFPSISLQEDGTFDRENLRKIGLVVFKAYLDASAGNKISFQVVESFVGSLDRDAKNPNTGATTFIDTLVNEQSEYVNVFSNCMPTEALKAKYNEKVDILVMPFDEAKVADMGFYEGMCEEDIDVSESILKAMDIVYDKVTDINERDIDIVVDGGISNIAQFVKTVYGRKGFYDPASPDAAIWKCKKDNDVKMWKTVIMKMDNFCKNIRKDCMFVADGPRPYCLQGQKKIVRPSKPANTIDANILPYTKYLTGINTSYGAGYCDWFQIADEFTGDYFWCPPSIKAAGVYIYTDLNYEYWDAPAGLNRGIIAALDVAFSPTIKQAGQIYTKSWNYAINYPQDGIVLEGQRTLQTKPSALDRVNVRRLMLRLERATYKVLRYVVYEGNTAYMRQRIVDLIDPYFKAAKVGGGLYDYKIICDETINTPETIDRNELHIKIGLKPVKTIEFIMVDFVLLSTGASWDEML